MNTTQLPPQSEWNGLIAAFLGERYYRYCGDAPELHDQYLYVPREASAESRRLLAIEPLYHCHKCDGYKWRSSPGWTRHSDDEEDGHGFTESRKAIARAWEKLGAEEKEQAAIKLYWLVIPEKEQLEGHFLTWPMVIKLMLAEPIKQAEAIVSVILEHK